MASTNKAELVKERFWAKVRKTDTCWLWTAAKNFGYGICWDGVRTLAAHRFSYMLANGQIPHGCEIDHLCRNPACVNPDHLEAVPHRINVQRGEAGKATGSMNRAKQQCPSGHSYTPENTYINPGTGQRCCRECRKEWKRVKNESLKAARLARGLRPPKSVCVHGHEFTPENTYVNPVNGQRACRTCRREWSLTDERRKAATIRMRKWRARRKTK